MLDYLNEIEKRMSLLNDETLIQIVTVDYKEYEPEAIDIARRILLKRGINYNSAFFEPVDDSNTQVNEDSSSIPAYYELYSSSGGYDSIFQYRDEIREKRQNKKRTTRPWARFFARGIDLYVWGLMIREILKLISINTYKQLSSIAHGYAINAIIFVLWIFVEGLAISKFGYTFGKWLLNIHVRNYDGGKLNFNTSLKRVFNVWFYGEGLSIPYLSVVTNVISYFYLKNNEITKWDKKLNIEVNHTHIGLIRYLIAIVIVLAPFILIIVRYIDR